MYATQTETAAQMATLTVTPNRFGSSAPGIQPTYPATEASMADTLPSTDFGFNDLRERMQRFTGQFDKFIARGRQRLLEERNEFRTTITYLDDQQRQRKQAIGEVESKSSNHAENIAKEAQESEEMHEAIRNLTAQRDEHVSRRDKTKAEIASVRSAIKYRRDAQAAHQRSLDAQAKHNIPELRFWETCLGMRIEGTGVDEQLRFVYSCLDAGNEQRECWFDLQMGGREYEVVVTKPRLEKEEVEHVQDRLNVTKELGVFLKCMRDLFVVSVTS